MMIILSVCLINMAEVKKKYSEGIYEGKGKAKPSGIILHFNSQSALHIKLRVSVACSPPPNFCIVNVMVRLLSQILNLRLEV